MANNDKITLTQEELDKKLADVSAKAADAALEKLTPVMMAMAAKMASEMRQPTAGQKAEEERLAKIRARQKCPECKQELTACKGKHVLMQVWPRMNRLATFFTGVTINGVEYNSCGPGRRVYVPAASAGEIQHKVQQWEDNELAMKMGESRFAEWNSGGMGGGQTPKPVSEGGPSVWR